MNKFLVLVSTFVCLSSLQAMEPPVDKKSLERQEERLEKDINIIRENMNKVKNNLDGISLKATKAQEIINTQSDARVAALDEGFKINDPMIIEFNRQIKTAQQDLKKSEREVKKVENNSNTLQATYIVRLEELYSTRFKLGKGAEVREALNKISDPAYDPMKQHLFQEMGASSVYWVYGRDTQVGFELINKSNNPIWITLIQSGNKIIENRMVPGAGYLVYGRTAANININKKGYMLLIYKQDAAVNKDQESLVYSLEKNLSRDLDKTIYVEWNGRDLSPQRGVLGGAVNATTSGYSLDANITAEDIKKE